MLNVWIVASIEETYASFIPDFDVKITQEYKHAPIHEMDKLIVHGNADQTKKSFLDGLFTAPSLQENYYNSVTEHLRQSEIRKKQYKYYCSIQICWCSKCFIKLKKHILLTKM